MQTVTTKHILIHSTLAAIAFISLKPKVIAIDLTVEPDFSSEEEVILSWDAESGKHYFIEYSNNLIDWTYFPLIETGQDHRRISWDFPATTGKQFFRIQYINQNPAQENPYIDDFDGDGVTNEEELAQGTNPLISKDLNSNSIPDDWETKYSVDNIYVDADGDGLNALQEYLAGSSPDDFYNGILPNFFTIESPEDTIQMKVTSKDDDSPIANAPVVFRATYGDHQFSETPNGDKFSEITVRTNAEGIATVYIVAP